MNDKIVAEAALLALTCHRVSHASRAPSMRSRKSSCRTPESSGLRETLTRLPQTAASIGTSPLFFDRIGHHTMFVAGILCAVLYDALDIPPRPHEHASLPTT
ncbi:hypothetical protein [Streptomyces sp. Ac-502]|uniref:hypothetical protein n=1 Tax=Streptomyces sp. Ac-502 TaxID=3342801 RepID=UPI003862B991